MLYFGLLEQLVTFSGVNQKAVKSFPLSLAPWEAPFTVWQGAIA